MAAEAYGRDGAGFGSSGGGGVDDDAPPDWSPRAPMSVHKGLRNRAGENNCFLNSAIQVCR
eukprot:CAMPEP_0182525556 /NCGR_PEP_ID=MMETSP1323-20130603/2568_1 /TAXON_ID=236787 /ORGANISM="Florenciella parvula, Strain RCC1693" /LENGTH=60 /DNA_ID=CAMNT_0024734283 /DNA_START=166 /DNA_END=348 /DNA_ORIENTATION=+